MGPESIDICSEATLDYSIIFLVVWFLNSGIFFSTLRLIFYGKYVNHVIYLGFSGQTIDRLSRRIGDAMIDGDHLDTDYRGAKKAGMTPVLIRSKSNKQKDAGVMSITSLKEVFKIKYYRQ